MSKNKLILIIGIAVFAMPFLGFPSSWKTVFYILAGMTLVVIAFISHSRRQVIITQQADVVTEVFVQTNGPSH